MPKCHSLNKNTIYLTMKTDKFGVGKILFFVNEFSFITRNKQHRVGVDAYRVSGTIDEKHLESYNLNVSHRATMEEVKRKRTLG